MKNISGKVSPHFNPSTRNTPVAKHSRKASERSTGSAFSLIGQLGLVIAVCIVGFLLLGIYLDRLVGSKGLLVFVMILVGLATAAYSAWMLIKQELP